MSYHNNKTLTKTNTGAIHYILCSPNRLCSLANHPWGSASTGIRRAYCHAQIFHVSFGIKLRSSCLHSKQSAELFPVLASFLHKVGSDLGGPWKVSFRMNLALAYGYMSLNFNDDGNALNSHITTWNIPGVKPIVVTTNI